MVEGGIGEEKGRDKGRRRREVVVYRKGGWREKKDERVKPFWVSVGRAFKLTPAPHLP